MKYIDDTGLGHAISKLKTLIAGKFDKTGGTITGAVTINGNVNANYVTGTWLQGTAGNHSNGKLDRVCVMSKDGWVYSRTLSEIKSDIAIAIAEDRYTYTTPERQTVSFTLPSYPSGSTLDIYINGFYCIPGVDYTVSDKVVAITKELDAGQVCHFVVRRIA